MAARQRIRWAHAAIGLTFGVVIGLMLHWLVGLSFWLALPLALVGLIFNGFLAEWEDNRPGGFNNPR